ncbi:lipid-transfer protein [Nocardioides sp.]|uniref:thiolase C-terminal domain-containing protein n=1 Tax=Nocardioides sp. TaxID=35761 RepID=UPI002624D145|nr:lipid-transfer protein [Nocardioides sp.]
MTRPTSTTPYVIGVGMTPFERIGTNPQTYPAMVGRALDEALADAGLTYADIDRAAVGHVFQPSAAGQRALYDAGITGIGIVNVTNNCATGATALHLAQEWVRCGVARIAVAVGFEQMTKEAMAGPATPPRVTTIDPHLAVVAAGPDVGSGPAQTRIFAQAALEHIAYYGSTIEEIAAVAVKNHEHSTRNPLAQFQRPFSLDEVLADKQVAGPLTRSQCSPMSDGASVVIVASADVVRERGLGATAVPLLAQELVSDTADAFEGTSPLKAIHAVGVRMTERAAATALSRAGLRIGDVDVAEVHDCFSISEVLVTEALGLCGPGEGAALVASGATTYGGACVINPSGGLIAKGHPLGATGLAQVSELVWQLRGTAGGRQVAGAEVALAQNLGLGGACSVTVLGPPGA